MSNTPSELLKEIASSVASLPEPDLTQFLTLLCEFSVMAIRGIHGNKVTDNFIEVISKNKSTLTGEQVTIH